MEQVKAPEKLYFYKDEPILVARSLKKPDANIEYTRTDAFIDKAWEWVENNILSSNQQDKSRLYFEQFQNYMKGG